jgi:ribonuclease-3
VSRPALGKTAEGLGLGPHLLLGRQLKEGRKNRTILAETLEALVAAVYLDGGPDVARAFVDRVLGGDLKVSAVPRTAPAQRRRRRSPRKR